MASPFYKVQAGAEDTAGTAVAATAKWMQFLLHPTVGDLDWQQREEERGSLVGAFRAEAPSQKAELGDLVGDVTFEDIIYPLLMAIETVTASQPDSSNYPSSYLWDFDPALTSANTPKTFTVEWGDDVQAWEAPYAFATGLKIEGDVNGIWQVTAPLVGRKNDTTTFTADLSDRTVESVLMNKSKLYMDDAGGTLGDTQITTAFRRFGWDMGEHFAPFQTSDGQKYFTKHSEKKFALGSPQLVLGLVLDSTTKTLITTKYDAGTVQLVRIESTGSEIESGSSKYIYIDGAYLIQNVAELAEEDGQTLVELTLAGQYDSTYAKLFRIQVHNGVATLP